MDELAARQAGEGLDPRREFEKRPLEGVIGEPKRLRLDLEQVEGPGAALQKRPQRRRKDHSDPEFGGPKSRHGWQR